MNRSLFATTLLILCLLVTGCLRSFTTVKVHRDGSATITDSMLFSPRLISMLQSMGSFGSEDSTQEEIELWNDSIINAEANSFGAGVRLDSWEEITSGTFQGYAATFKARDIGSVRLSMQRGQDKMKKRSTQTDSMSEAGDAEADEDAGDTISFSYASGLLTVHPPVFDATEERSTDSSVEEKSDKELRQNLDMMSSFLRGIRMGVFVTVDGTIKETNASHVNGDRMTIFYVDFDKLIDLWESDLKAFREFDKFDKDDPAAMRMVMERYPPGTILVETKPSVTIRF
jgi:hypothetical protein